MNIEITIKVGEKEIKLTSDEYEELRAFFEKAPHYDPPRKPWDVVYPAWGQPTVTCKPNGTYRC